MPYKRIGTKIYRYRNGKWSVKQKCQNVNTAKAALRILKGLEKSERA